MHRRLLLVVAGAFGFLLLAASVALACTDTVTGGVVLDQPFNHQSLFNPTGNYHSADRCGDGFAPDRDAACRGTETWAQLTWPFQPPGATRQYDFYPGVKPDDTVKLHATGAPDNTSSGNAIEYKLFFLNHTRDRTNNQHACMSQNHQVDASPHVQWEEPLRDTTFTTDGSGNIGSSSNPIDATIPTDAESTNAHTGPAALCFMSVDGSSDQRTNSNFGTNPAYLTIL